MASERYNAPAREKHWQKTWEDGDIFSRRQRCLAAEVLCP